MGNIPRPNQLKPPQKFQYQGKSEKTNTEVTEAENPVYMDIVQSPQAIKKPPLQSYLQLDSTFRSKHIPQLKMETPKVNPSSLKPDKSFGNPNSSFQNMNSDSGNATANANSNPYYDWPPYVTTDSQPEPKEKVIREELYEFLPMPPSASTAQEQINSAFSIPSPSGFENEDPAIPRRSNSLQDSSPQGYNSPNSRNNNNAEFKPRIPRRAPLTPPVHGQINQLKSIQANSHTNSRTSLGSNGGQNQSQQGQSQLQHQNQIPNSPDRSSTLASPRESKARQSRLPMFSSNKKQSQQQRSISASSENTPNQELKVEKESGIKSPFGRRRSSSRQKNKNSTPPALPPNHPTSPAMSAQRREFSQDENQNQHQNQNQNENQNQNQNSQMSHMQMSLGAQNPFQGSPNSPQDNVNLNRVLTHHDPWIREIARKYASPPQSPSLDNRNDVMTFNEPSPQEEARSRSNTITQKQENDSDSDHNQDSQKRTKKNKGSKLPKQSSIPVKRGPTPVNKTKPKTKLQKSNSQDAPTSHENNPNIKNKKSLKLKIPSLLRKHTSSAAKYNSNPVVTDALQGEQNPVHENTNNHHHHQHPVFVAAQQAASTSGQMSPRMLRNHPPTRYNHLIDPRQSMPVTSMGPMTPEAQRRNVNMHHVSC